MVKTLLIIIPARKGSVRVPNKNLRPIGNGETLVSIAIKTAQIAANYIPAKCNIWLSTDYTWDELSASRGFISPDYLRLERPPELCTAGATSEQVVTHALNEYEKESGFLPDDVMLLQPTSPLRAVGDVCVAYYLSQKKDPWKIFSTDQGGRPNGAVYITGPNNAVYDDDFCPYVMPPERSLDIDTEEDFALADKILKGKK